MIIPLLTRQQESKEDRWGYATLPANTPLHSQDRRQSAAPTDIGGEIRRLQCIQPALHWNLHRDQ